MFLTQGLIGAAVILSTSIVHGFATAAGLRGILWMETLDAKLNSIWARSLVVGVLVLLLFAATLLEAGIWAVVYLGVNALPDLETAFYFSVVTYTTLGFGDVVIGEEWRLLSAFEAVNGVMMFGWTTALVVVALHRFSRTLRKLKELV